MLKRYFRELWSYAAGWFTSAGVLIALIWFLPVDLINQAALTAFAALASIFVGSYRAWRGKVADLDRLNEAQRELAPVVRFGQAQFDGGYSAAPKDRSRVIVQIAEARNRSDQVIYIERPEVTKWSLSPRVFSGPGKVTLHGRNALGRPGELERAPIPPGETRFDLQIQIESPFQIETREQLAAVLKQLHTESVTLRFAFVPATVGAVELEAVIDFTSFKEQVLGWWRQEKWVELLTIWGNS
jgi:hypothetical protein